MNEFIKNMEFCIAKLSELHLKLYESPPFSDIEVYDKGKKFCYVIDENIYGKVTYKIYDIETNKYIFGLNEEKFHKYFSDIKSFREKQLNEILKYN